MDVSELRAKAKEFLLNPNNDPTLPEKVKKTIPLLGDVMVTAGVISLQNDRSTTYSAYLKVQNELIAAYNEVRDNMSRQRFGNVYDRLTEDQQKAIQTAIPQRISEAEPVEGKK